MAEAIQKLPDDASYEEIMRELAFERMVERGLEDSRKGNVIENKEREEVPHGRSETAHSRCVFRALVDEMKKPIHIGSVIRNAFVFNLRNWTENSMNTDSLLQSVERLFDLMNERQIDYLLVGGIALLCYVEGRNTEDIDLILSSTSLERLPEISIVSHDAYFARGQFDDLQIDILLAENPLFAKVQRDYTTIQRIKEREIATATVEGLLLLKLYALPSLYRQGNFAQVGMYENDIATLTHYYKPDIEPLLDELRHHLSETDVGSLEDVVAEIKVRIERFRKGSDQ